MGDSWRHNGIEDGEHTYNEEDESTVDEDKDVVNTFQLFLSLSF